MVGLGEREGKREVRNAWPDEREGDGEVEGLGTGDKSDEDKD